MQAVAKSEKPAWSCRKIISRDSGAWNTADTLNQINPYFIRIRTLSVSNRIPLAEDYRSGIFRRTNDVATAEELLLMLKNLDGITSYVKSDHIVNLLPEVKGQLPQDRDKMTAVIEKFLNLPEEEQLIYRAGRRTGTIACFGDSKIRRKKMPCVK